MAQIVVVEWVDDLDGTPIRGGTGETVDFSVDGVGDSVDLGPKTPTAFGRALDACTHATRTDERRHRRTASGASPRRDTPQTHATRELEWAHANGYEISARGRPPADVERPTATRTDPTSPQPRAAPGDYVK